MALTNPEITSPDGKLYLSTSRAMKKYNTTRQTLDARIKAGKLTRYRVDSRTNYFLDEELEREFRSLKPFNPPTPIRLAS